MHKVQALLKSIYPLVRSLDVEVERDLGAGTEVMGRPWQVVGGGRGRELGEGGAILVRRLMLCGRKRKSLAFLQDAKERT